ncbi:MAG: invasin domain 3-containing protein [Acidobacteriota bacterium]
MTKKGTRAEYFLIGLLSLVIAGMLTFCSLDEPTGPSGPLGDEHNPPEDTGSFNSISLSAFPGSIPADGFSSSIITATVKDQDGNPAPNGLPVDFTTEEGSLSADGITPAGTAQAYTAITSRGEAIAYLISSTKVCLAEVQAKHGEALAAVNIQFYRTEKDTGRVDLTVLGMDGSEYKGGGEPPLEVVLMAVVYNRYDVPIPNADVIFSTENGHFDNGNQAIKVLADNNGTAYAFLHEVLAATVVTAKSGLFFTAAAVPIGVNVPPTASLVVTPTSIPSIPYTVTLDASGSTDPNPEDAANLTYDFTWQATGTAHAVISVTGPTGSPYATATIDAGVSGDIVTFIVTVTDPDGLTARASATVTISIP